MKRHVLRLVAGASLLSAAGAAAETRAIGRPTDPAPAAALEPATVVEVMQAAADWQLAHPATHATWDWTQAAFYTGVVALGGISDDPKYLGAMRAMAEGNAWRPGLRPGHADDYAVIATYAKLYEADRDRRLLAPSLALFDFLLSRRYDEPLTWGNRIETRELAWCDALFMGPPALAAVATATGDRRYLELASRLWWKTTDYLYDREERLYYRDSRFFDQREPNGRKVFWSRGNGWVLAGLARLLGDLPEDDKDRERYQTLFRDMAVKVAGVQGDDGFWRASLLDPASLPNPETSGTGFFTYALAWGINQGLLKRRAYEPNVRRGWAALVSAVHEDGMLGFVQRIGYAPGSTTADTTEVYGVGALLLAGSEVFRMALLDGARELALTGRNTQDSPRFDEAVAVPRVDVVKRLEARPGDAIVALEARSGAFLPMRIVDEGDDGSPERLELQASFLAGEKKGFLLRKLARPWRPPVAWRVGSAPAERKDATPAPIAVDIASH
jgi:unsaturated rhamnogalacturonyl hydrolase